MSFVEAFNEIAEMAVVPKLSRTKVIPVQTEDIEYPITVWLKRRTKVEEFAGANEDGYRWLIVHQGIKPTLNNKPF